MKTIIAPFSSKLTFQRQLSITVTIGIFLLALVSSIFSSWQGNQRAREDLLNQGLRVTESLAGQSALALIFASSENVKEAVKTTLSFPNVVGLDIRTSNGKVVVTNGEPISNMLVIPQKLTINEKPKAQISAETEKNWEFTAAVYSQPSDQSPLEEDESHRELLGYVTVVMSKAALTQITRDIFLTNLLSSLFFALLFLLLIRFLTRGMTRPLEQLASDMGRAQRGENNVRAQLNGPQDIANMANAFNEMMIEQDQREAALRIAAIAFETEEGMVVTDATPVIIRINHAFTRLTGYTPEEVIGQKPAILRSGLHDDAFYKSLWQTLNTSKHWQGEIWNKHKDNSIHPEWLNITAVLNNEGIITNYVGTYLDITDRKNAEFALQESARKIQLSEARLKDAQKIAKLGNWELDISSNKLLWSDEVFNIFETDKEHFDATYQAFLQTIHPDDREMVHNTYQQSLKERSTHNVTYRLLLSDGRIKWVEERCNTEFDDNGLPLTSRGTVQDITTQKQTEMALFDAKQTAESASRTKSEFLANMSHEIRTPMNAILGLTQLVLESGLPPRQEDFLKKAHTSARALLGILNDILDYSKIEAGHMTIERIPFHLEDTLTHVSDLFDAVIEEKGLEIFFEVCPNTPTVIVGDPLRLSQVLTNLVSNAVKFTEHGEIHVKTELMGEDENQLKLRFSVRDTGVGMTDAQAKRLFQSFSQGDESTTRKYGGTGLGLSISQRLVGLMGGEIVVSTEEGRGSTFSFTIQVGAATSSNISQDLQQLRGLNILVVDDQETARVILQQLLQNWGEKVQTAASGDEALNKIRAAQRTGQNFDIVLLDWRMPGMDGLEVVRRIQQLTLQGIITKPIQIVMVTAHDREQLLNEAGNIQLNGILTKPVIPSQLFNTLVDCRYPRIQGAVQAPNTERHKELRGMRILLVEDNRINRLMATEFLQRRGVILTEASHGAEAVEMVKQHPFDAVLMDLHMPVMDGIEATKVIRELPQGKNLPIIAMTAAVLQEDVDRCSAVGMVDFIAKPIEPDNVINTLLKWVKIKDPNQSLEKEEISQPERTILPERLPGFDLETALHRIDGNKELLAKLIQGFAQDYADSITKLDSYLNAGDVKGAITLLHTIKGVAANLGASHLAEAARQREHELKFGSNNSTQGHFVQTLRSTLATINEHLYIVEASGTAPTVEPTEHKRVLEQLLPYLQQQELIPTELMDELNSIARSDERTTQIVQHINNFDHYAALHIVEQVLAELTA